MAKIYSRPRIKLPKACINGDKINKKKLLNLLEIIIIFCIAGGVSKYILDAVNPIFDTLCEAKSKSMATMILNEQTNNVMKQYSYEDIFTIERNNTTNKIIMIKSNTTNINIITTKIALNAQKEIDSKGSEDISIALRKFYRVKIIIR